MQVTSDDPGTFSHAGTGTVTHCGTCIHAYVNTSSGLTRDISVPWVPPYLHLLGNHLKKTDENHLKFFFTVHKVITVGAVE